MLWRIFINAKLLDFMGCFFPIKIQSVEQLANYQVHSKSLSDLDQKFNNNNNLKKSLHLSSSMQSSYIHFVTNTI